MTRPFALGHRLARLFWMLPLLLLGFGRPAWGFPIFARKYQTSCATCHTIYPKLNPFGQAFRLNGYRMPKETEELIKQKQVSMGSEAYKRLWPSAIWPSELPGNAPVAVNIKMESVYNSSVDDTGAKTIVHNDFQFPQEVNLFTAGTLGEHMSFMAELTHGENADGSSETEIEHARLDFDSLLGPEHAFNLRIGKFAPNLYDGFQEMWIMTDNGIDSLFMYNPVGFNGGTGFVADDVGAPIISLPARVRGIELYGVLSHRFFWTFGFASKIGPGGGVTTNLDGSQTSNNGNYNNNSHKDFYARIDYKFGGMGLDGDTEGVNLPPENWRESSLRVGLLGLSGNGKDINFQVQDPTGIVIDPAGQNYLLMQDTSYQRAGAFVSWIWGDLNLFGAAIHGTDRLQLSASDASVVLNETDRRFSAWFAEADYVITQPFQASARYERLNVADPTVKPLRFMNLNLSYLVFANVKAMVEYRKDLNESRNYGLNVILRAAF